MLLFLQLWATTIHLQAVAHRPAGKEGMCLDRSEPPELRIELQPPTEHENKQRGEFCCPVREKRTAGPDIVQNERLHRM